MQNFLLVAITCFKVMNRYHVFRRRGNDIIKLIKIRCHDLLRHGHDLICHSHAVGTNLKLVLLALGNGVLLHFSLSVKAAPHACVIRTNPS